jgi:polysaccharide export outer membrane protein
VAVNVWKEPEVSRAVVVRPDGKIALPLAGEFQAAGRTTAQLEEEITKKLLTLMQNPQVTVIVQEIRSQKFSVVGEVRRPGTYSFQADMTVLEAVAQAGGLSDFAKPKKMYVLRTGADGKQMRIPVNYKDVVAGKPNSNVKILSKDTLVVP